VSFFLDYKMVMAKHVIGDMITIKSIIENPATSVTTSTLKIENFDKANNKPQQ
jgi:hypothetical protein